MEPIEIMYYYECKNKCSIDLHNCNTNNNNVFSEGKVTSENVFATPGNHGYTVADNKFHSEDITISGVSDKKQTFSSDHNERVRAKQLNLEQQWGKRLDDKGNTFAIGNAHGTVGHDLSRKPIEHKHVSDQHYLDQQSNKRLDKKENAVDVQNLKATSGSKKSFTREKNVSRKKDTSCNQEDRQRLLGETCEWGKAHGTVDYEESRFRRAQQFQSLYVDDDHKVIYCDIPKVASTSWKVFFANLSEKVDPDDYGKLHDLVHDTKYQSEINFRYLWNYTYEERMYRLQHYFKFLVTRNPFDRLISAYENKFAQETYQSNWYHVNVGTEIIRKYRENPSAESLKEGRDVTFEEFIQFFTDRSNILNHGFDLHWWRIQGICHPCLINYNYIAKIETFREDIGNIMENIVPGKIPNFPHLNSNMDKTSTKITQYYSQLSQGTLHSVQRFYDIDLKLFGYSMTENAKECKASYKNLSFAKSVTRKK